MSKPMHVKLIALSALCVLAGCSPSGQFADLEQYIEKVQDEPKGQIPPLPKFRTYEAFAYSASGLRSPFLPPVKIEIAKDEQEDSTVKPDPNRQKEYLENFGIESFEMVGTMSNGARFLGLVKGGDGIHKVEVGNYLGRNHGKITDISETKISVIEIVPTGKDRWVERPREIELKEGG
ncbi:pilus assembly protein PilP [Spartinivicinus poritis]|uniref:Pilus assembly protein PilP n=1 Tax=Spartinivicinus poritis TaxID=2994640 RepID=A0ABT5U5Y4_9GAMM|nr:pilus assembly protein PilP [Spartinivicinus sp. A2-2]MDE1461770.1 pilus assembly protein PilP [Spartinivicinus sp. A2-2]